MSIKKPPAATKPQETQQNNTAAEAPDQTLKFSLSKSATDGITCTALEVWNPTVEELCQALKEPVVFNVF